jgi:hypothetical protein
VVWRHEVLGQRRVTIRVHTIRSTENATSMPYEMIPETRGTLTSKINSAGLKQRVFMCRTQKAIGTPEGMRNNWIDKARQKQRIVKVRIHLASFRQGTSYNCCRSGGESILEEPKGVAVNVFHEEIGGPNKAVWIAPVAESTVTERKIDKGGRRVRCFRARNSPNRGEIQMST